MAKIDYKKDYKHLYLPKTKPEVIEVPEVPYVMIDGQGDPNQPEFQTVMEALYGFSYTLKMSCKTDDVPEGYYEYTVFSLEGVWDLVDPSLGNTDKTNYKYTVMIRQPDFITEEIFEKYREIARKKKGSPVIDHLYFRREADGLCVQMMHIGPYDDEPRSFAEMDKFCEENGYVRKSLVHREIYLSDPRKAAPEKMRTVLRYQVEKQSF